MPTVSQVINVVDRTCAGCQKVIKAGEKSVKDRRERKKGSGKVRYYHPDCYKRRAKA